MSDVKVPELGESIVEASILNWLKQEGDTVQEGDALAELETDKVNVEVIANESGVLQRILKGAGETVAVGETIAVIAAAGAAPAPSPAPAAEPAQSATPSRPSASAAPEPPVTGQPAATPTPAGPAAGGVQTPPPGAELIPPRPTPSMRRMLREQGVDPAQIAAARPAAHAPEVPAAHTASAPAPSVAEERVAQGLRPDEERVRMSRRRLTIARRLVEAQHTAAMLTTFNEVDMTKVLEIRKRRKDRFKEEHGVSLGFMSFFTKAAVAALKAFPRLNAEIQGEDMILKYHYDIGIAVATEGGLVVPVVRDADRLNFAEIEQAIADLADKARNNKLTLADLQGGTFTITNGGVFGSLFSTPLLNGPQVGILAMHGIQERPVAVNGQVEIRPMMYIALSYDHRIVDGSEAVRFLVKIKQLIEDPESLMLEG
ncbi:MAG: 2-oxoglutarate dehydrogenase complex dihydrolipoyllysine-residue succinyltransferase [Alicyclobacillus macrosporangiidus]|uniref:2-oxoglutarate dehydrogenase complex dihydrolipoyllysine-residue succinyltransferase n=1 Tax=Alicyclobacillus macrosporangiidus TaxID=392015 RepID=UPI0026EDE8EE|nr:2-oxoglutarate dehydrogenase complex dihydrolipoyllysine-residue succinyltransferase [Alicyclobacillus macrosporangiidus]MCL6597364.1 2-oxoglutarate dehydrogenase complex dihydrolipoyllysine-residue succinyltransferase [Alicyclobacillus macrosporangiidus]